MPTSCACAIATATAAATENECSFGLENARLVLTARRFCRILSQRAKDNEPFSSNGNVFNLARGRFSTRAIERSSTVKKLMTCSIVLALLIPLHGFAQPSKYVKLGVNYSSFRTEGGKSDPGLTMDVDKNFYPIRSFNGFWGFGVNYVRKKVTFENRTWPSGFDPMYSDVVIGDINVDIAFIEIPLRIGYTRQLQGETARLEAASGLIVSLPVKENNDGEIKDIIFLEPDEKGKFDFDYLRWQDVRVNSTLNWQIALAFFYQVIGIEFRYSLALGETKASRNLTIQDSIDSFKISLVYSF